MDYQVIMELGFSSGIFGLPNFFMYFCMVRLMLEFCLLFVFWFDWRTFLKSQFVLLLSWVVYVINADHEADESQKLLFFLFELCDSQIYLFIFQSLVSFQNL